MLFEERAAAVDPAKLLIGDGQVDHITPQRKVPALQVDECHQLGDAEGFDIERAATPDVTARAKAGERGLGPLTGDGRYDVDVVQQYQRLFIRPGDEAGVDRLTVGIRSDELRLDPFLRQQLLQKEGACSLVSRRIRRVDTEIGNERGLGLTLHRIAVSSRGAPALDRSCKAE